MSCAVKFCGGCNSRYDRGAVSDKLKLLHNDLQYAKPGHSYDILYVICGCTAQCTDISMINSKRIVWIYEPLFLTQ